MAGQYRGHGHHIGLLVGPFAVGEDAVNRVPARCPRQFVIGGDVPGYVIQAGRARRQIYLVQQVLELAQRRGPSHARPLQRPRSLRLLRAESAAPGVATHRTIVPDPSAHHGLNSANASAR
ncbi:hypothetical protein DN051_06615 [Streptomyces cadmiisoli]|uniref:Uncharacterized protein n=1 Tax=Streptomyces cadmiisoli TaxID=2184053 RepID=A0A2Z4IW09_9ACTN|nr:hypothetical protein DN051_06615 [Streptomyces cadmiisoli]